MNYETPVIPALPDWTVILGFFLGTVAGSFLNMVIYRLPRGISFWNPSHSICPICKHKLDWIDLMPLFSWLSTRGKCRYCAARIPVRYFLVELLCGALFVGIWWQYLCAADKPLQAVAYLAVAACLVAVIFIDAELFIIPDELNALILILGLAYGVASKDITTSLLGALTGWGLLWGITLLGRLAFGKDAMGHGDIKLMRGLGALLGPAMTAVSLVMAVFVGLIVGVALIVAQRGKAAPAEVIPEADTATMPSPVTIGDTPTVALTTEQSPGSSSDLTAEPTEIPPESIGSIFKFGVWYLLCLDVVGVFVPGIYKLIGEQIPDAASEEIDDWKPTVTTIPFGPYLAAGCLVCMIFSGAVQHGIDGYFSQFQSAPVPSNR